MRPTPSRRPSSPEPVVSSLSGAGPVRHRLLTRAGALLVPTLLLAACGGGSAASDDPVSGPVALPSQTATPTPSAPAASEDAAEESSADEGAAEESSAATGASEDEPEVWATFTEEPGRLPPRDAEEAFADDPRVAAVRTFNEEFARAATAGDPQRPEFVALVAPEGYDALLDYLGEEFGKRYPGPLPFTLLDVADGPEDGTASVQGCIVSSGFALGTEGVTGQTVTPIEYALVTDPATEGWLVEAIWAGAYDCSTVTVEARAW
ncbi:hypothetical protein [Ornithinimicrobium flavum]|uniref:hypothetical protein n=1 Tax=Ornithinimicrobium flavum TaxID=1288636 RepID=UPI00107036E3|nr:hypothetical protein [Ornithinimicrobium flavum]